MSVTMLPPPGAYPRFVTKYFRPWPTHLNVGGRRGMKGGVGEMEVWEIGEGRKEGTSGKEVMSRKEGRREHQERKE